MAQADYVTNAIRASIPGDIATRSTSHCPAAPMANRVLRPPDFSGKHAHLYNQWCGGLAAAVVSPSRAPMASARGRQ